MRGVAHADLNGPFDEIDMSVGTGRDVGGSSESLGWLLAPTLSMWALGQLAGVGGCQQEDVYGHNRVNIRSNMVVILSYSFANARALASIISSTRLLAGLSVSRVVGRGPFTVK